jgi:hypothetical protein
MLSEYYYAIYPLNTLIEKLKSFDQSDFIDILQEPVIWLRKESSKGNISTYDKIEQVKLLFLANLWTEFSDDSSNDVEIVLQSLLGEPPFSAEIFDQWWGIWRFFGVDGNFSSVESRIRLLGLKSLCKTDNPLLIEWMERI